MGRVGAMTLQKIKDNVKLGDLLADTLANLNAKVSDATLDTSSATRTPSSTLAHESTHVSGGSDDIDSALAAAAIPAHDLGGAKHTADTLADLNAKVSDATLMDSPPAPRTIATGSITGDGGAGRQITVGFKCSMVVVVCYYPGEGGVMIPNKGVTHDTAHIFTGCALHASDGFTIGVTASERINANTKVSYYWAISE